MSLSQLAELACAKRPFSAMQYIEQLALPSDTDLATPTVIVDSEQGEPPRKKVRFTGAEALPCTPEQPAKSPMASSPQELERLMEKVRQRAERRRNLMALSALSTRTHSPLPPPTTVTVLDTTTNNVITTNKKSLDLPAMQRKLQRMEHAIKKSARAELQLMNQSKKLREKRATLTRKYESMAQQLAEMQQSQAQQQGGNAVVFQMGVLPPLMDKPRRVSATPEQIINLTCSM